MTSNPFSPDLDHKSTAATVEATEQDLGKFAAIAAAWTVDRQNDAIALGAFHTTIRRWQKSGRKIPLHWSHREEAHNVIGVVYPESMAETAEGLYVEGKLDLERSAVAKEAWRSIKADAVGLSFGFLAQKSHLRSDGVKVLDQVDLFEVSITTAPANPDTRFLDVKGMKIPQPVRVATFDA